MSKRVYYVYNPETDNYERAYRTLKDHLKTGGLLLLTSLLAGTAMFLVAYYGFSSPDEQSLRSDNARLRGQLNLLNSRLDNSLKVMEDLQQRDDNLYRVLLQMEPVRSVSRTAGLANEARYRRFESMPDGSLLRTVNQQMDLLERQLYVQSQSYDQLSASAATWQDRLEHVPAIMPLSGANTQVAGGFGYRKDPIYGALTFHDGLDFLVPPGTPVLATADGIVTVAEDRPAEGTMVEIDHGYNYVTRYCHLSHSDVKAGDKVSRRHRIGLSGNSGNSQGSHLHYEVIFKDQPQNPVNYFFLDLTPKEFEEMLTLSENSGRVMD